MSRKWLAGFPVLLIAGYFLGPSPSTPEYAGGMPVVPAASAALEQYVYLKEAQHTCKPDNQARIVWSNDSSKQKTRYAFVYLHGFSASQAEGEPVHKSIAKKFKCNLYLSRLAEHGIDTTDALIHFTADNYWASAKEALAIGKQLGDSVILMATSTGATLALLLAAVFPEVHSLVLLSPNIAINDPNAWLLNNPWGLQIARLVLGSEYNFSRDQSDIYKKYWYSKYRVESAVQLQELLETSMTASTFNKISQPVLTLYYYKDKIHQDSVVKVPAMLDMMNQLRTPVNLKRSVALPATGDHVIGSYIKSKDLTSVETEITKFMNDILQLKYDSNFLVNTMPKYH